MDQAEPTAVEFTPDLAGLLAHELRTPVTTVLGYCHALQHGSTPLTTEQTHHVAAIERQAQALTDTLASMLDAVVLGRSAQPPRREPIDPEVVVQDALAAVELRFAESGNSVSTVVGDDVPVLFADRVRVRQILINLLSNAAKYAPGTLVTVELRRDGHEVLFIVSDRGPGLVGATAAQVFNAYVQGDQTAGNPYHSVGLGLAIARWLAGLLGGTLTLATAPGEGCEFTLRLPWREER